MSKEPELPALPDVLRAADQELGADVPQMMPVYLTKTEHMIIIHALKLLKALEL